MTPAATRPPALPVGWVLRSSAFSWTIRPRPRIECGPEKLRVGVDDVDLGDALGVGLDVAEVADVPLGGVRAGVLGLVGVEVAAGRHGVGRGDVAELVDVEPVHAGGQAADLGHDADAPFDLGERDLAAGLAAALGRVQHGDGLGDAPARPTSPAPGGSGVAKVQSGGGREGGNDRLASHCGHSPGCGLVSCRRRCRLTVAS